MRNLRELDEYRVKLPGWSGDAGCGAFMLPSPKDGKPLAILASDGDDWEHVSVSRSDRVPNWYEMEHVRRKFFKDDECVMQLHVPVADYVDGHTHGHPHCLHMWRPQKLDIPRPPKWMVGGMPLEDAIKAAERGSK